MTISKPVQSLGDRQLTPNTIVTRNMLTNRKHKVLGKIVIPRINDTIAYIQSEMEEHAREEFFRMKKIIQVKCKHRNKQAEQKVETVDHKVELVEELPPTLHSTPLSTTPVHDPTSVSETVPPSPIPEKKVCRYICVPSEMSVVIADVSSSEEELIQEEPIRRICGKPKTVSITPPMVTPKASIRIQLNSNVSSRPSVRITVPKEDERVPEVSMYEKKALSRSVSKTTVRSFPKVPSQRSMQGPVCKICSSCRPRPQCRHKVIDGNACEQCQTCCKPSIAMEEREAEQISEVIILGDGYDEGQFGTEEMATDHVDMELTESLEETQQHEDAVSIDTIGTIGDLSLEDDIMEELAASGSYMLDPIYKIESLQTTTINKITKKDGTVIEQKEVTKITMETVPEDIEQRKSREIIEQIADMQKFLCKSCVRTESSERRTSVRPEKPIKPEPDVQFENTQVQFENPEVQFANTEEQLENLCACASCPDLDSETICLCKKPSLPERSNPAKCSYEWSCGGAVPECSVRKKKKEENSHGQP